MTEISRLTFSESLRRVARGELTPADVMAACLESIRQRDPVVRAFVRVHAGDHLLTQARAGQGACSGLPFAVKDVYETADLPTEFGSSLFRGNQPRADAATVGMLRRAGAVLVGKTSTTELAYFAPARTSNPHDRLRTPGGSSSGSAAAVAAGMVPVAFGTQTAGSTIRPAAYCGVVGYVGTFGELATRGVQQLAPSLDTVGIIARSVEDVQLMRRLLLTGAAPGSLLATESAATTAPTANVPATMPPATIAVLDEPVFADLEPDMIDALGVAVKAVAGAGVALVRPVKPHVIIELTRLHEVVMAYEAARTLVWEAEHSDQLSDEMRQLLDQGWATSPETYRDVIRRIALLGADVATALAGSDAVLCPAALGAAPLGLGSTGSPACSRPWQAMAMPTVTIPGLTDENRIPLGIQLVGQRHDDDRLLAVGRWLENILPPPPVPPG